MKRVLSFVWYAHEGNELLTHYFGWIMGISVVDNAKDARFHLLQFKDSILRRNKLRGKVLSCLWKKLIFPPRVCPPPYLSFSLGNQNVQNFMIYVQ